jgi:hypothetical protein
MVQGPALPFSEGKDIFAKGCAMKIVEGGRGRVKQLWILHLTCSPDMDFAGQTKRERFALPLQKTDD